MSVVQGQKDESIELDIVYFLKYFFSITVSIIVSGVQHGDLTFI